MATVEALRVGDRIADKYIVERILGQGGMGIVVAARHVDLDQMVAIKFILPDALRQPGIVERLLREARASARLRSEHVAKVIDVGRTPDGAPYLVMELLEGRDLAQMLDERTVIPAGEAALYVGQACEAIAEAHAAGIIHRDIKPANLFLVARRDGSPCVKVLDFGIAKEDSLANAAMTSTGSVLGTPMYMSPEQVRSAKTATPATDIWALGITLYELTTGQIPYDVTTVTELIAKILTEPPIPARARNPSLSAEMEAVIMRCLQVDPTWRYASASALRDALDAVANARAAPPSSFMHPASTVVPSSDSPTRVRESPFVSPSLTSPHDRPVAALTQASPGLTPGPVRLASRTESGTSHAVSPPKGSPRGAFIAAAILVIGALAGGGAYWATREPVVPALIAAQADRASVPSAGPDVAPGSSAASPPSSGPEPATSVSSSAPGPSAPAPSSAGSVAAASPSASAAPEAPRPTPPGGKRPPATKPPDPPPSPPPPTTTQPGWGRML